MQISWFLLVLPSILALNCTNHIVLESKTEEIAADCDFLFCPIGHVLTNCLKVSKSEEPQSAEVDVLADSRVFHFWVNEALEFAGRLSASESRADEFIQFFTKGDGNWQEVADKEEAMKICRRAEKLFDDVMKIAVDTFPEKIEDLENGEYYFSGRGRIEEDGKLGISFFALDDSYSF
jgi:hypothetical protein